MIVVEYRRTQAGAMQRLAERGRTLSMELPAPKVQHKPVVAPAPRQAVVLHHLASHAAAEGRSLLAWPKPERPAYLAVEPVERASPRRIIAKVMAWHPGITVERIMGPSRRRPVVAARHDAIVAVYVNCRMADGRRYSLPELGRVFGGRDHTTCLHALRKRGYQERAR